MTGKKGNFGYNYPRVIQFLNKNDIEFIEYSEGQHLRILGPVSLVDLWPSRMTYHIVEAEEGSDNAYRRLNPLFDQKELEEVLGGKKIGWVK